MAPAGQRGLDGGSELGVGQTQPGLEVELCLDDIERYGIHVTDAHVSITEQAIGQIPSA